MRVRYVAELPKSCFYRCEFFKVGKSGKNSKCLLMKKNVDASKYCDKRHEDCPLRVKEENEK